MSDCRDRVHIIAVCIDMVIIEFRMRVVLACMWTIMGF